MDPKQVAEVIKDVPSKDVEGYVLINNIQNILRLLEDSRVIHSGKEANTCADILAKVGRDGSHDVEFQKDVLIFLINSLVKEANDCSE